MPELISNTSPLQYLHLLHLLHILPSLASAVYVLPAVVAELAQGRELGYDVPDPTQLSWITIEHPSSAPALRLLADLGPGEAEVLALGLEHTDRVVVLDDGLARRMATASELPLIGTLGLFLDAKHAGLVEAIHPFLEQLQKAGFRLAPATREAVLKMADEAP